MRIIWTESAVANLEDIKTYIARDSQFYAAELIGRIIHTVESLARFPRLGREVPEVKRKDVREIIYRQYRIMYRLDKEVLYILAIIHAVRDIKRVKPNPWDLK